jgi:hypothetical protein
MTTSPEELVQTVDYLVEAIQDVCDQGWNGARWRRRSLAEIRQRRWALGHRSFRGIAVDGQGVAEVGDHPWTPILLRVN